MGTEKCLPRNRGRPYVPSKTEEVILFVLFGKKLYGLQIPQAMEEASGGWRKLQIGSLYPTLHKLEKKGLITSMWGDEERAERGGARRRYYELTPEGISTVETIQDFHGRLFSWLPTS